MRRRRFIQVDDSEHVYALRDHDDPTLVAEFERVAGAFLALRSPYDPTDPRFHDIDDWADWNVPDAIIGLLHQQALGTAMWTTGASHKVAGGTGFVCVALNLRGSAVAHHCWEGRLPTNVVRVTVPGDPQHVEALVAPLYVPSVGHMG